MNCETDTVDETGSDFWFGKRGWPALLLDAFRHRSPGQSGGGQSVRSGAGRRGAHRCRPSGPAENGTTPEQFLAHWGISPAGTVALKFLVKGGGTGVFSISICSFIKDAEKCFIFQAAPEAACRRTPKSPASEASFAQKQKLDCALQLARTVSLDFNNALTSILGHTSLLLGKAEPGHPWRRSLLEVEKSAAARGGNRQRTCGIQPAGKGSAPRGAGEFERGGEPLRGFFPQRARRGNCLEAAIGKGPVRGAVRRGEVAAGVDENSGERRRGRHRRRQSDHGANAQRGSDRDDAGPERATGGGHLCLRGNHRQRPRASRRKCCRGFSSRFSRPRESRIAASAWRWFTAS